MHHQHSCKRNMAQRLGRAGLSDAQLVVVKVGTAIAVHGDGNIALGRLGHLVEQISRLIERGKNVILVSSGSVGLGRRKLGQQELMNLPLRAHIRSGDGPLTGNRGMSNDRAYAAAGQAALMHLYEVMFRNFQVTCAQVLVTDDDFRIPQAEENLRKVFHDLLQLNVVPIVNENDVVSLRLSPLRDEKDLIFWDNDSLATAVGQTVGADLICLLTDVQGLYEENPKDAAARGETAKIINVFDANTSFTTKGKSRVGRGGMEAKVNAAATAVENGVGAVVIASGKEFQIVERIVNGEDVGTLFIHPDSVEEVQKLAAASSSASDAATTMATTAREAGRRLATLTTAERNDVLIAIAQALMANTAAIVEANQKDLINATSLSSQMKSRLKLGSVKLKTVCDGIMTLATMDEPLGRMLRKTELANGLVLTQRTCPIGVLMVVFESRPDVLPQVAALAIRSGNGLLLKGGKEARHTNTILHSVVTAAVEKVTRGRVAGGVVGLVQSREDVSNLLALDGLIDLVIPRGGNSLMAAVKSITRIPVLGHADGICHVYIDSEADVDMAVAIAVDSKTDYPAACNALETLLVHSSRRDVLDMCIAALKARRCTVNTGPRASAWFPELPKADSMAVEYGDLELTVEVVDSVAEAIDHINKYSSGHTDCIVTANAEVARAFQDQVDSACVYWNASSRFSDGIRFGLGAEVGISTGRIHARGPVGVEGLLTTKWTLVSEQAEGDVVSKFTTGERAYTHCHLAVESKL